LAAVSNTSRIARVPARAGSSSLRSFAAISAFSACSSGPSATIPFFSRPLRLMNIPVRPIEKAFVRDQSTPSNQSPPVRLPSFRTR
jgi:hypothetical protein